MTAYLSIMAVVGILDALNDDWRDRPNGIEDSQADSLFRWLRFKVGWEKLWRWYQGTKLGHKPNRIGPIVWDYWHTVKVAKRLLYGIGAPVALFLLGASVSQTVFIAGLGFCVEAAVFVIFYNFILPVKLNV